MLIYEKLFIEYSVRKTRFPVLQHPEKAPAFWFSDPHGSDFSQTLVYNFIGKHLCLPLLTPSKFTIITKITSFLLV
jgi:hypothetical protein